MNAVTRSKTALGSVMTPYIIEIGTEINIIAIQISTFDLKTMKKPPFYFIAYNKGSEFKNTILAIGVIWLSNSVFSVQCHETCIVIRTVHN